MSFRVFAFVAVATLGFAARASADVLFDNLGVASVGYLLVHPSLADSFSTGATGFAVSEVDVLVAANIPLDGGSFTVSLLSDNSTSPGSLLDAIGTVEDSALTTAVTQIDLTLSTPYDLAADTTYWIELAGNTVTTGEWSVPINASGTGVAGQSNYQQAGGAVPNFAVPPFQMEVSGEALSAAVPEPASLSILGAGLIGFVALQRRKRKAA